MTTLFNKIYHKLIQEARHYNWEEYKKRLDFLKTYYSYELSLAEQQITQTDNINDVNQLAKDIKTYTKKIQTVDRLFLVLEELMEMQSSTGKVDRKTASKLSTKISCLENPEKLKEWKKRHHAKKMAENREEILKQHNKSRIRNLSSKKVKDDSRRHLPYDEIDDVARLHNRFIELKREYPVIPNVDIFKIIADEEQRSLAGITVLFGTRIFKND